MFKGRFNPGYDDAFFGGSRYRRGRAQEEERQRREMEAYQRAKQQEAHQRAKQQELRRKQEVQRRRELEALRRKQAEEEHLRRLRAAELERQEKIRRQRVLGPITADRQEKIHRQRGRQPYNVVRGRDGRLYRVPIDYDDDRNKEERYIPEKRDPSPTYVRGRDGRIYQTQQRRWNHDNESTDTDYPSDEGSVDKENIRSKVKASRKSKNRVKVNATRKSDRTKVDAGDVEMVDVVENNPSRRRATIIVEDVPEDEIEDETKSFWRNRHPGPGESWMEPIR